MNACPSFYACTVLLIVSYATKWHWRAAWSMPPKKDSSKSSSKESSSRELSRESTRETCCVCCQRVCTSKDEVLFCVSNCQQWTHRYCASVSAKAYQRIRDNTLLFWLLSRTKSRYSCGANKNNSRAERGDWRVETDHLYSSVKGSGSTTSGKRKLYPKSVQCSYATAAAPRGESVSEGKVRGASSVNTHAPGR